jgi:NADH:ubiquinone oxidoreductase subunit 5 (subunit L)/multisubunit Na+/H+ antiporter MnhA subunit
MNRVGDIGFLIGVSLIFSCCYTLDFSVLEVLLPVMQEMNFVYYNISVLDLVCFFFYIGVMGKSAQLGLHT